MKTDKLEIGKDYWLDRFKDESGTFIGDSDGAHLFKPHYGCHYVVDDSGLVGFPKEDDEFFLVSKIDK